MIQLDKDFILQDGSAGHQHADVVFFGKTENEKIWEGVFKTSPSLCITICKYLYTSIEGRIHGPTNLIKIRN